MVGKLKFVLLFYDLIDLVFIKKDSLFFLNDFLNDLFILLFVFIL